MDTLALVGAALISVLGALVSAFYAHRLARGERMQAADELAARFREPLLQSAFNLQSRLFNIARMDFLGLFLTSDSCTEEEKEYAVRNTVYLVGQYLGWVEVIRRESQYVDPRSQARNREIAERLEQVRHTLSDSRELTDPVLRLFRGEQRAIAEKMLTPAEAPGPGVPRLECKGYAKFVEDRDDERVQRWFRRLEDDVVVIGKEPGVHLERLSRLQHDLLDLIGVLDPSGERVPLDQRERL